MIENGQYINIQAFMRKELDLGGNELLVYALIYGFSQGGQGKFFGSYKYIADWVGVSEKTAFNVIEKLIAKKLIVKGKVLSDNGVEINTYSTITNKSEQKTTEKTKVKKVPLIEREPVNDIEKVEKEYLLNDRKLYEKNKVASNVPSVNWTVSRKLLKNHLQNYGIIKVLEVIKHSINNKWIVEKGYGLGLILSANVFSNILNEVSKVGVGVGCGKDTVSDDIIF